MYIKEICSVSNGNSGPWNARTLPYLSMSQQFLIGLDRLVSYTPSSPSALKFRLPVGKKDVTNPGGSPEKCFSITGEDECGVICAFLVFGGFTVTDDLHASSLCCRGYEEWAKRLCRLHLELRGWIIPSLSTTACEFAVHSFCGCCSSMPRTLPIPTPSKMFLFDACTH